MLFSAAGNQGNNAGNAELRHLFNCPFHAVEFENGKVKKHLPHGGSDLQWFAQIELNPRISYRGDAGSADGGVSAGQYHVELLANFGPQDPSQVNRILAEKRGAVAPEVNFIGDPAAASHGSKAGATGGAQRV